MPTYTAKCHYCDNTETYISRISERHNTPACSVCGKETTYTITPCQLPIMAIADHMHVVSPIDGSVLRNKDQYEAHMKKHNVRPSSEFEGQKKQDTSISKESIKSAVSQAYDMVTQKS